MKPRNRMVKGQNRGQGGLPAGGPAGGGIGGGDVSGSTYGKYDTLPLFCRSIVMCKVVCYPRILIKTNMN